MVLPLRDDDTDRHAVPVVTYALIAVNILVWLVELNLGDRFINGYSTGGRRAVPPREMLRG